MDETKKIVPILIGTDVNAYGMARSFHQAYGVKSHCVGVAPLVMTKDSEICDVTIVDGLKKDDTFVETVKNMRDKYAPEGVKPIIISAGDEYTELVIRNRGKLAKDFHIPYPTQEVLDKVYYKDNFYTLCAQNHMPYPRTVVASKQDYEKKVKSLSLDFPVAMKPADAAQQIAMKFEGQRKAYKFADKDALLAMMKRTYDAGYKGNMLIQDFIPGGDAAMYTVNFYADRDSKVRQITMGQQLLQDPSPFLVGNYVATFIQYHAEIEEKLMAFIKAIGYTGLGNFDLKYDERDEEFKLIELNPRQGRSAFYATASGHNLMVPVVDDLVFDEPFDETEFATNDFLWLGVNPADAVAAVEDPIIQDHMQALIAAGQWGNTLQYRADRAIRRNFRIKKYYASYRERFKALAEGRVVE